jgi:hypothetical protein
MVPRLIAATGIFLSVAAAAGAHRLDECLQATLVSVEKNRVELSIRLIPGVAVSSSVISSIDSNRDGVLSLTEQRAYAQRLLDGLSLSVDGNALKPRLVTVDFPQIEQMRDGLGEIHVECTADLPRGGAQRKLVLESHNQEKGTVYLVNCLVSQDPEIQIAAQKRNELQSFYELDYTQASGSSSPTFAGWWAGVRGVIRAPGTASLFRLGVRHIAEGTDHLLFLLVLLLPAPLAAVGSRWAAVAPVRSGLLRILGIVTAFTIGHSITLALAAFGFVRMPVRPVEVLIAVSILVSAIHALRPIFPGKEAGIAAFFGLIHGLAFASTLGELGLGRWERLAGILAFNLGIEAMQLAVVAATLPSLILMSRTRVYSFYRVGGAVFAGVAATGWIAERLAGLQSSVDMVVNDLALYAVWIAGGSFLVSLVCWRMENPRSAKTTSALSSVTGT